MFVLTVAAAEAAIGLAILVVYFRNRGSIAGRRRQPDEGLSAMMFAVAVFAPLLGAAVAGLFGRCIGDRARPGGDDPAA